jgi:hypothetical protein
MVGEAGTVTRSLQYTDRLLLMGVLTCTDISSASFRHFYVQNDWYYDWEETY